MRLFFLISFILFSSTLAAQRGGNGGLMIYHLFIKNKQITPYFSDFQKLYPNLKIKIYPLSNKGKPLKAHDSLPDYRLFDAYHKHKPTIYIPTIELHKPKNSYHPSQRLEIIYYTDTMTIDFFGVLGHNGVGVVNEIDTIRFIPGYYKFRLDGLRTIEEISKFRYTPLGRDIAGAMYKGINISSDSILKKYKVLEVARISGEEEYKFIPERSLQKKKVDADIKLRRLNEDSFYLILNGTFQINPRKAHIPLVHLNNQGQPEQKVISRGYGYKNFYEIYKYDTLILDKSRLFYNHNNKIVEEGNYQLQFYSKSEDTLLTDYVVITPGNTYKWQKSETLYPYAIGYSYYSIDDTSVRINSKGFPFFDGNTRHLHYMFYKAHGGYSDNQTYFGYGDFSEFNAQFQRKKFYYKNQKYSGKLTVTVMRSLAYAGYSLVLDVYEYEFNQGVYLGSKSEVLLVR